MFTSSKKKAPHGIECMVLHCVVAFFLFVAFSAAGIGLYLAHFTSQGPVFGTVGGSLSLLAFAGTLLGFMKALKACMMPCEVCEAMGATTVVAKKK